MPPPPPAVNIRGLSAAKRHEAIVHAGRALAAGQTIILPTDTVYGVALSGASSDLAGLRETFRTRIAAAGPPGLIAWHPGAGLGEESASEELLQRLGILAPAHRLLLKRLITGPAIFLLQIGRAHV